MQSYIECSMRISIVYSHRWFSTDSLFTKQKLDPFVFRMKWKSTDVPKEHLDSKCINEYFSRFYQFRNWLHSKGKPFEYVIKCILELAIAASLNKTKKTYWAVKNNWFVFRTLILPKVKTFLPLLLLLIAFKNTRKVCLPHTSSKIS